MVSYVHSWSAFATLHPGVDFLLTSFESWRRSVGHYPKRKMDMIAVASPATAAQLMQHTVTGHLCQQLSLPTRRSSSHPEKTTVNGHTSDSPRGSDKAANSSSTDRWQGLLETAEDGHAVVSTHSQCWVLASEETAADWSGFPFVLDLLHLTHPAFQAFVQRMQYTMLLQVRPCPCPAAPRHGALWS